jgi:hypothetical protein
MYILYVIVRSVVATTFEQKCITEMFEGKKKLIRIPKSKDRYHNDRERIYVMSITHMCQCCKINIKIVLR